jgi:hypothetical protein
MLTIKVPELPDLKMDRLETETIDFPCKKLGDIAHVNVEYFYVTGRRFLTEFKCDRVSDCGITRSPFSGTYVYTTQCPLYIVLENNFK